MTRRQGKDILPQDANSHQEREGCRLNLRERFGCFFLVAGFGVFLLYAIPLWQAFRESPEGVPFEWLGIALVAAAVFWVGWKFFASGRRNAVSQKPQSLGERVVSRWRSGNAPEDAPDEGAGRRR